MEVQFRVELPIVHTCPYRVPLSLISSDHPRGWIWTAGHHARRGIETSGDEIRDEINQGMDDYGCDVVVRLMLIIALIIIMIIIIITIA